MFYGATTKFNPRKIFVAIEIAKISSCENFGRAQIEKIHFRKMIKQKSRFFFQKVNFDCRKERGEANYLEVFWTFHGYTVQIQKKIYVEKVFENQPDANIRLICYLHSMRWMTY